MTDLAEFGRRWDRLCDDLEPRRMRGQLERVVFDAKHDVTEAVKAELGDESMSHWDRGKPIRIRAQYDIESDTHLRVRPTPRAAAPMRTLQRRSRVWSRAASLIQARIGRRYSDAVHDVLARHLHGS